MAAAIDWPARGEELVEPFLIFLGQAGELGLGVDQFGAAAVGAAVQCQRLAQKAVCGDDFAGRGGGVEQGGGAAVDGGAGVLGVSSVTERIWLFCDFATVMRGRVVVGGLRVEARRRCW